MVSKVLFITVQKKNCATVVGAVKTCAHYKWVYTALQQQQASTVFLHPRWHNAVPNPHCLCGLIVGLDRIIILNICVNLR